MATKTITFDLRPLQIGHENRGIGMVVKSVLENLPDDEITYLFYMFDKSNPIKKLGIKVSTNNYQLVQTPTLKHEIKTPRDFIDGLKMTFHTFKPLRKYRPDAFVQFDISLGIPRWRKLKKYTVGYDLIPMIMRDEYLPSPISALRSRENFTPLQLLAALLAAPFHPRKVKHALYKGLGRLKSFLRNSYHLTRYKRSLLLYKKVDGVFCISKATKQSFQRLLHISDEKLFDFPLAPVLSKTSSNVVADKVKKPYILYIGGTDDRKRVQDIVHAFNIVRGRGTDLRLVLAGNEFRKADTIPNLTLRHAVLTSPYEKDIILTGFVNDAEKLGLYQNALAFVFSSAYEGFGLPLLEAAVMGCPVIAYDNSSISELATSGSALLVETGNFRGIAKSIPILLDEQKRTALTEKAKGIAQQYTWDNSVDILLKTVNR